MEVDRILEYGVDVGIEGASMPFFHPGQFKWQDATTVFQVALRGDKPLVLRRPQHPIVLPTVRRSLNQFKEFATQRKVAIKLINIDELIAEFSRRVSVLTGFEIDTTVVWAPLLHPVTSGFQVEHLALMALALHFFGNTELALAIIYCVSKNSKESIRKMLSKLWANM